MAEYFPLGGKKNNRFLFLQRGGNDPGIGVMFRFIFHGTFNIGAQNAMVTLHSWRNMHILKNNADAEGTPRPTDTNVLLE